MATARDPDDLLRSNADKENFQRLTRLLITGGTTLLREIFDMFCSPNYLPKLLKDSTTKNKLKAAKLSKPLWDCLYPSPRVYGKSQDFDVTLLFRLLRTLFTLIPPGTGWDELPASEDHSLEADLARIKYYRNSIYGHASQNMEMSDAEFSSLWNEISEALVRIAGHISPEKKTEWQKAINKFFTDPLTEEDGRNVEELLTWYRNDMEVKKSIEKLETTTQEMKDQMDQMDRKLSVLTERLPEQGGKLNFFHYRWRKKLMCALSSRKDSVPTENTEGVLKFWGVFPDSFPIFRKSLMVDERSKCRPLWGEKVLMVCLPIGSYSDSLIASQSY